MLSVTGFIKSPKNSTYGLINFNSSVIDIENAIYEVKDPASEITS